MEAHFRLHEVGVMMWNTVPSLENLSHVAKFQRLASVEVMNAYPAFMSLANHFGMQGDSNNASPGVLRRDANGELPIAPNKGGGA